MKPFSIIVAFDSQYGIGKKGELPWSLSADLRHFKEVTCSVSDPAKMNAVIMGRKTWESLPAKFRPLPQRVNLVITRQTDLELPSGVICCQELDRALTQLNLPQIENIFVIGGAQIYALAIDHPACQKIYVTHVQGDFNCDAFFPPISRQFILTGSSEPFNDNGLVYHFSEYLRS